MALDYCDFNASAAKAVAGKDILLAVWNADATKLLAVAGQQTLTINRSADEIEDLRNERVVNRQ